MTSSALPKRWSDQAPSEEVLLEGKLQNIYRALGTNDLVLNFLELRTLLRSLSDTVTDQDINVLYTQLSKKSIDGIHFKDVLTYLSSPVQQSRKVLEHTGEPGDLMRGLSVHYLSMRLLEDLGDGKVYEVEPRIRDLGKDAVCPRDHRVGAAYVDVARDQHAGVANMMLSYTWGYTVRDIVDALVAYTSRKALDAKELRMWICCLCVNQWRVKEAQNEGKNIPFEEFEQIFGTRVRTIGHVLALLSPWDQPIYVSRVWCVFELYTAIMGQSEGIELELVLPQREVSAFIDSLVKSDFNHVLRQLQNINVEAAESSHQSDKQHILRLVKKGHPDGYHGVNLTVIDKLRDWFISEALHFSREQLKGSDVPPSAAGLRKVSRLLCTVGRSKEAVELLGSVLGLPAADSADSLSQGEEMLLTLLELGEAQLQAGLDKRAPRRTWQAALKLQVQMQLPDTESTAFLLMRIGATYQWRGDIMLGLEYHERAMEVRNSLGIMETDDGSALHMHFAGSYCEMARRRRWQGGTDNAAEALAYAQKAVQGYEDAKRVREKAGLQGTVRDAKVLGELADAMLERYSAGGDQASAEELAEAHRYLCEAKELREHCGAMQHEMGMLLLMQFGKLRLLEGKPEEAIAQLEKALDICRCLALKSKSRVEAETLVIYGQALLHLDKPDEARERFFAAKEIAVEACSTMEDSMMVALGVLIDAAVAAQQARHPPKPTL